MNNTYWSGNGKHQELLDKLHAHLVPPYGKAETRQGEVLRSIGSLYYDMHNNGWCNWSDFLEERGIVDRFLRLHRYNQINWNMSEDDIPDAPWLRFGQVMEEVVDFIVLEIERKLNNDKV